MSLRLHLLRARPIYFSIQPSCLAVKPAFYKPSQQRWITADEKPLPTTEQPTGPNQDQLPHVSEEAAAIDKAMGVGGPDIEQGTPVQDILKRDPKGGDKAPKVMQDDLKNANSPSGSRSYSTSARRSAEGLDTTSSPGATELPPSMTFKDIVHGDGGDGHKFGLPKAPLAKTDNFKKRYDPVVQQLTRALMRDGKLSAAQRTVADILDILRTAPPPQSKSTKPGQNLLPSAGPLNLLPLNPVQYLTAVFDSVSPLVRIRQEKGKGGGGTSLPIPVPVKVQYRRRTAMRWVLESANKRREIKLANRVSREIINVAEGTSAAWDKRQAVHKAALTARINVKALLPGVRRKRI